ncbi:heme peroxidase [Mycena capillaripes]|nr:heme peroxidase [Mycena capillaripes]
MLSLLILVHLATTNAYIWPSPQLDALESLRFDSNKNFVNFLTPCDAFLLDSANSGRSNAADWIRTAYHDMATHNVEDGTGGLDGSIRFDEEQARPENVGDGFEEAVVVFSGVINRYISMADSIAIGAILAVEKCGGPTVAFRAGRIDAVEPNAPGVPQPQEDLNTHIASFARQGFTQTEMISLVACGHTFGGLQHGPFPDIVPELNDPLDTESVAHFDSTNVQFDNNIATEYILGTTQNPLVIGLNDTTNSDKRIFGSDNNVTMQFFANSPELFASTCADLLARMIDTVPKGVELSEVIAPLPVKPDSIQLILAGDTLQLTGQLRLWDTPADPDRTVRFLWDDHVGSTANNVTLRSPLEVDNGRTVASWYDFNGTVDGLPFIPIDAVAGITSMKFAIDDKLEDQGGVGFAVQDSVVSPIARASLRKSFELTTVAHSKQVRNGVNPTRVYLEEELFDSVSRPFIVETDIPRPTEPVAANAAYSIWSFDFNVDPGTYTIGAEIDGVKITTSNQLALFSLPFCSGVSSSVTL